VLAFVAAGLGLGHAPASVMRLRMDGVSAQKLKPATWLEYSWPRCSAK
jgi:hypothetical protein